MKALFLSPHNDDETLFASDVLLTEKPLVVIVTDSWIQFNRGDGITPDRRWNETVEAMKILKCPVMRLGLRDDVLDESNLKHALKRFEGFDIVYAPALQGGNFHHDMVNKVAKEVFGDRVAQYATYARGEFYTKGPIEIELSAENLELKNRALDCYQSQINLPSTKGHFDAVRNSSESYFPS